MNKDNLNNSIKELNATIKNLIEVLSTGEIKREYKLDTSTGEIRGEYKENFI